MVRFLIIVFKLALISFYAKLECFSRTKLISNQLPIYHTTMKQLFTLVFSFLSLFISAQQEETHQIKIFLEDAETGKNIDDAKVTLEGFEIPPIISQYDKKGKYYYFRKKNNQDYTLIYIEHKDKEPQTLKTKSFPQQLSLKLYKKGTTIETKTEYVKKWSDANTNKTKEDSVINSIHTVVSTLDHYKTLILLKNSSNLTYSKIRSKIDSIVVPLGLEYIDDLVPKMYFIKFYGSENCSSQIGENSIICNIDENKSLKKFFKENPSRVRFAGTTICGSEETIIDFLSENKDPYNNQYDWEKNCYILPYRKRNKKAFRVENDSVLNKIKKNTSQLEFGKIIYNKFDIYEDVLSNKSVPKEQITDFTEKLSSKIIDELDVAIMNYAFLSNYNYDYSRVLLMDYNIQSLHLNKYGLSESKDLSNPAPLTFKSKWRHSFLLDEFSLYPEKQTTDFYNKPSCNLQRFIGYSFLFD